MILQENFVQVHDILTVHDICFKNPRLRMQYNTETGSAENHAMTAATTNTNCLNHLQVTGPFPLLYLFHLYIVCAEV